MLTLLIGVYLYNLKKNVLNFLKCLKIKTVDCKWSAKLIEIQCSLFKICNISILMIYIQYIF